MERLLETRHFGPHRVDVVEHVDDLGTSYVVLVDGVVATTPPLDVAPRTDDVMRIYARSLAQK